jgi:hypothetical protein
MTVTNPRVFTFTTNHYLDNQKYSLSPISVADLDYHDTNSICNSNNPED